jgi:ATP-dependent HslUV protease subunit HslV
MRGFWQMELHPGQLKRACVEMAKMWRTDKYLRPLEATMIVADQHTALEITGRGDVLEPADGIIGIGSGSPYAIGMASHDFSFSLFVT